MTLWRVPEFKVFSSPVLERWTARWIAERREESSIFTLLSHGEPVTNLFPADARELVDALQKFLAVTE